MLIITGELAQRIVDSVMPLAQQNVNIMDSRGIIVGSGHKHRINTFHKGAKDAIESNQIVEIYPADVDRYPGALPGLNLPIFVENRVIGVVGVSGHPDEVRNTARMVEAITKLIVEREMLREEFRSQSRLQEQFVSLLLSERADHNREELTRQANFLHFTLDLPRLAAVVNIQPLMDTALYNYGHYDLIAVRTQETLSKSVLASGLVARQDITAIIDHKLIILKHVTSESGLESHLEVWSKKLINILHAENPKIPLQMGIGSLANHFADLHRSYREALFALHKSCSSANKASIIYDFDLLASYLVRTPPASGQPHALAILKDKINNGIGKKYDIHDTLACLLANNLNITSTAQSLYIHRNTLLFRLNKLKEVTGLDPCHNLNHAILCKVLIES